MNRGQPFSLSRERLPGVACNTFLLSLLKWSVFLEQSVGWQMGLSTHLLPTDFLCAPNPLAPTASRRFFVQPSPFTLGYRFLYTPPPAKVAVAPVVFILASFLPGVIRNCG